MDLLAAKDREIARLKAQLAAAASPAFGSAPPPGAPPPGEQEEEEETGVAPWITLETRLRSGTDEVEEREDKEVTQPYEVTLRGAVLGFQLVKTFVSVRRDGVDAGGGPSLSKLFGTSALAAPFAIQERAVVMSVQSGGVAETAGVVVRSSLRAINGVSTDTLNYTTVLSTIRAAGRPLRLLFTPPAAPHSVMGKEYCNSETITLEYRTATPHALAAVDRLCDVSAQLGGYLDAVEHAADSVVERGYAFLAAMQQLGSALGGGSVRDRGHSNGGGGPSSRGRGHSGSLLSSSVRTLAAKTAKTAAAAAVAAPSNARRSFFGSLTGAAAPESATAPTPPKYPSSSHAKSSTASPPSSASSRSRCLYSNCLPTLGDISVSTRSFHSVMDEFCAHFEPFLETIKGSCADSTRDFKSTAISRVKHLKGALKTAQAAHEAALNKVASIKSSLDRPSIRAREAEAAVALLNFEFVRFELTRALNFVESRKKIHLLNMVTDSMLSLHGFVKGAEATVDDKTPMLRELKRAMFDITQSQLGQDDAAWRDRREELEQSLRRNVARMGRVAGGTETGVGAEIPESGIAKIDADPAPGVGALSVITGNVSPSATSSSPSTPDIEGYLFVPAGMFGGGWRRVWHFVQNGKLFAYPKASSMDSLLVADLLVSQVKPIGSSGDVRYAFELRTPASRSAIVLQASNDDDRARWILAITSGVERALHKQSAIAAALSQQASIVDRIEDALTPETFLLQACNTGTIDLQRSSTAVLKRECRESGSFLVWQFSVVGDPSAKISFVVRRKSSPEEELNAAHGSAGGGGDATEGEDDGRMIDIRRMTVVCDGKTHQGKMLLPFAPCPCQLVFDNTHSLLYSRTVTVKVEVVAGSMMEAALVAARDDFTRLEKEAEAMRAANKRIAQSTLKSDDVLRRLQGGGGGGNAFCADCSAPRPDWVSINLGVTICIKCSGVHRSLGSHISKVRSMQLDVWTDELVKVIELAGNARARKVWESDGTDSWVGRVQHLSGEVGRDSFENAGGAELRSAWIKAKYSDCAFLAKREKRRFSDASVLTLGSVVTGLCVAGKWDELLECLEGAAGGNKARDGVFAEHAVDLELSAPWTVLYLTTV